jgi:hypothetical protein
MFSGIILITPFGIFTSITQVDVKVELIYVQGQTGPNMSNFVSMFRRFAVLATKEPKIMWVCNLLALSVHDVKEFEDTKIFEM